MVFQNSGIEMGPPRKREPVGEVTRRTSSVSREAAEVKTPLVKTPAAGWLARDNEDASQKSVGEPVDAVEFDVVAWFAAESEHQQRCITECWYG